MFLVILEEIPDPAADTAPVAALPEASAVSPASPAIKPDALAQLAALQDELRAKDEYLQSTYEELESSNEELKSSNEEMQSVNEELQSTNEELETSKEELQSVNEELSTVNSELNIKVDDLSRLNNDMNNLLAGTGIATVFVDHQLRILRFTPTASQLINLIGLRQSGGRCADGAQHPGAQRGAGANHRRGLVHFAHSALPHTRQRD